MIFVDELRLHPGARPPFHRGSCHLTTDGPLGELHAFAAKLGMQPHWFQPRSVPHYDLTRPKRALALRLGAVYVSARRQAIRRREAAIRASHVRDGDRKTILELLGPINLDAHNERTVSLFAARVERVTGRAI